MKLLQSLRLCCLMAAIAGQVAFAQPGIQNASFETNTNAAFGSDHTWQPPTTANSLQSAGTMTIGNNTQFHHTSYNSFAAKSGSNMLIVNALGTANSRVWSQTITGLTVGQNYRLAAFGKTAYNLQFASLFWRVGSSDGAPVTLGPTASGWSEFSHTFIATSASQFVEIRNANGSPDGNDFAIDDLSITAGSTTTLNVKEYLYLGGRLVAIEQGGSGGGSGGGETVSATPTTIPTFTAASQIKSVSVHASIGLNWVIDNAGAPWVVPSPASGIGGASAVSINLQADPNFGPLRNGQLVLRKANSLTPAETILVSQAAGGLSASPDTAWTVSATGQQRSVTVTTNPAANWSVTSNQSWLVVSPASGPSGNAFTMTANPVSTSSPATVTVSSPSFPPITIQVTHTIGQGGDSDCTFESGTLPTVFSSKVCRTPLSGDRKESVTYTAYNPASLGGANAIEHLVMLTTKLPGDTAENGIFPWESCY